MSQVEAVVWICSASLVSLSAVCQSLEPGRDTCVVTIDAVDRMDDVLPWLDWDDYDDATTDCSSLCPRRVKSGIGSPRDARSRCRPGKTLLNAG